jgi:hypothetical protein
MAAAVYLGNLQRLVGVASVLSALTTCPGRDAGGVRGNTAKNKQDRKKKKVGTWD